MIRLRQYFLSKPLKILFSGCGAVTVAHYAGGVGVAGSNPVVPTIVFLTFKIDAKTKDRLDRIGCNGLLHGQ